MLARLITAILISAIVTAGYAARDCFRGPRANIPAVPRSKLEATNKPKVDWAGAYYIEGAIVDGKPAYTGVATIWKLDNGVYACNFIIGSKGVVMYGIGKVIDGQLVIGWAAMDPKGGLDARGLTIYEPTSDGGKGTWIVLPGGGKLERETIVWLCDLE